MYLSILALPIFGSAIAGLRGRSIGVTGAHIITTGCLMLSAILMTALFSMAGLPPMVGFIVKLNILTIYV